MSSRSNPIFVQHSSTTPVRTRKSKERRPPNGHLPGPLSKASFLATDYPGLWPWKQSRYTTGHLAVLRSSWNSQHRACPCRGRLRTRFRRRRRHRAGGRGSRCRCRGGCWRRRRGRRGGGGRRRRLLRWPRLRRCLQVGRRYVVRRVRLLVHVVLQNDVIACNISVYHISAIKCRRSQTTPEFPSQTRFPANNQ